MKKINFLLFLSSVFLLWGCRTEIEVANVSASTNIQMSHNKISLASFKQETRMKNFEDIISLRPKKTAGKNEGI